MYVKRKLNETLVLTTVFSLSEWFIGCMRREGGGFDSCPALPPERYELV